ncbi:ATP-binding protein [Candidatus Woesearchaeota archaeon]|nr:MAG: ATP-binding protein [Candidatus Woesearchaeota archaeon]
MSKGLVIGGEFGNILVRQKHGEDFELGELLIAKTPKGDMLLQVFDLLYGSQLSGTHVELVAGLKLEEDSSLELMDSALRNYIIARIKALAMLSSAGRSAKTLPAFFDDVRKVKAEDMKSITGSQDGVRLGSLRSGSRLIDVPVRIDAERALSHHILVAGTTGRGKSVFMKSLLCELMDRDCAGLLVLDPHNEYYSFLKDHPRARDKVKYYSPHSSQGAASLKIHLKHVRPSHFNGVINWSDPQRQALSQYYSRFKDGWIEAIVKEEGLREFREETLLVVRRVLMQLLGLELTQQGRIRGVSAFDPEIGESTVADIVNALESAKTVIIDTSSFDGRVEVLIASMIANHILRRYKHYSLDELRSKPVVGIVLEEAPRVLGAEVLRRGQNVFSTIAREGRKFRVGLVAITQLPSLIPREVLANMNTKVIFGVELKNERSAIIESASQDLSSDERMIASLDRGEAIVTSNFLRFATPIKVIMPKFDVVKSRNAFAGVNLQ